MPAQDAPTQAARGRVPSRCRARDTLLGLCTALLGAALLALCDPGAAHAGEWVQVSCINPNQTAAGSAGWSSFQGGGGYGSNNGTGCGPGSSAFAILSTDAAVPVGSDETLQYTPPAGSTLNGGLLDLGMYADGRGLDASGTAVAYTPEYAYDASSVFFQCASGLTPCANGGNDFTGELEIPSGRGGDLYLSAGCGGAVGQSCDEGGSEGGWSVIRLWWANLRLSNDSTPAASGVSGTLLAPEARGMRELTFTATDPAGPGVYNVTAQADGQTLYSATPNSNGGACVAVGSSGASLMFDASQPCRQSESVDLPIDTTAARDGEHTLKVTVSDAAQNASVVYDAPISTHNAPADSTQPLIATSGQLLPGSTLSAQHGEWAAPTGAGTVTYGYQWQDCDAQGNNCEAIPGAEGGDYATTSGDIGHTLRAIVTATDNDGSTSLASPASGPVASPSPPAAGPASSGIAALTASGIPGAPNGTGASEVAWLRLAGHATISRSFASRAFTITGQLLNGTGVPIGDAALDVREQVQGSNSLQVIGRASTAANGAFTVHVPAGPSRLILLDYRAFSTDPGYAAQAAIQEVVTAGVQMHVTPRRIGSTGEIVLSGRVAGPVPRQGVVVELLVHYRGHWEPFRDPRTSAGGRFDVRYQFEGAVGRFPFRAEVLGEQSGFPYGTGESAPVDVISD